jgi:hypothetical protein
MYGGPVNYTVFYNAGGWGPAIVANFPPMIWFLTVSLILIRRPRICRGVYWNTQCPKQWGRDSWRVFRSSRVCSTPTMPQWFFRNA